MIEVRHDNELAAMMFWSEFGSVLHPPFAGHVVLKDGAPVGAFIVNGYDGINCDVTVFGHFWSRGMLQHFARYVFGQLKCVRASARTRPSNLRAVKALLQLGFKYEGTQRRGFGDEDAWRFGLLADEFRYKE